MTRANAASSPPTMIDSVPLFAPISPPLTGASSIDPPFAATSDAESPGRHRRDAAHVDHDAARLQARERRPASPVSTSSTSAVSGTIVMTTVDWRATSAGEAAAVAPAAASSSTGPRLRLWTTRRVAVLHQIRRHRLSHHAEADKPNCVCHIACAFPREV